jgi:long-chain fatty acid transport protein
MRRFNRAVAAATVSLVALAAYADWASAGGFAVREQSATAQGMSFAGAASGSGGLSSMFWNPAAITMRPGWNSEYHASLVIPEAEITPIPGTSPINPGFGTSPLLAFPALSGSFIASGDIARDAIVPASYSNYQFNERLWVGLSSTSPFGLVTKPETFWSGQIYARSSKVFTLNFNPIVGYKVTDWLSIAGGPVVQYIDVRLKRALGPLITSGQGILEGDDIGFGFSAGVMLTPWAGTQIGIGYRSMIHHELEGSQSTSAPFTDVPIRAKVNLPEMVTVGLTQWITPSFNINLGFEWTNWSRAGTQAIVGPAGLPINALPLNYEDGYFYSLGAEYWFTPRIALRAGVAYEESPITDEVRTPRLPDNDRVWLSLGATYRWSEKLSFDASFTHIFVKDTPIGIVPGHAEFVRTPPAEGSLPLNFVADVDASVNIFSVALKYRWDDPKVAIPAAPIVRKY